MRLESPSCSGLASKSTNPKPLTLALTCQARTARRRNGCKEEQAQFEVMLSVGNDANAVVQHCSTRAGHNDSVGHRFRSAGKGHSRRFNHLKQFRYRREPNREVKRRRLLSDHTNPTRK